MLSDERRRFNPWWLRALRWMARKSWILLVSYISAILPNVASLLSSDGLRGLLSLGEVAHALLLDWLLGLIALNPVGGVLAVAGMAFAITLLVTFGRHEHVAHQQEEEIESELALLDRLKQPLEEVNQSIQQLSDVQEQQDDELQQLRYLQEQQMQEVQRLHEILQRLGME